jgi:hypothetical protein
MLIHDNPRGKDAHPCLIKAVVIAGGRIIAAGTLVCWREDRQPATREYVFERSLECLGIPKVFAHEQLGQRPRTD